MFSDFYTKFVTIGVTTGVFLLFSVIILGIIVVVVLVRTENTSSTNTLPHTERNVNIMLKDVIKEEREEQDLSLSELARRCGHAVSTLHAIENGDNTNPSYRTIADICAALGLSLDELEQRIQKNKSDKLSQ